MQTFLPVLLMWITPSFLFVGWRLWMSRPLRDVHYRHRWEYSHALKLARLEGRYPFKDLRSPNRPGCQRLKISSA